MDVKLEPGWRTALKEEFEKPYFSRLAEAVRSEYASGAPIYPRASRIFAAFDSCPFDEVKVVIIGQDPYHGPGQANGLAFSVNPGVRVPPSLANIFKEVNADVGAPIPADGDLSRWAIQGVLLMNATLTVRQGAPRSHASLGWDIFTDAAVHALSDLRDHLVFLLWGSDAIRKGAYVDRARHLVLTSPHPSPLSAHRGFFGNRHFSQANAYLEAFGKSPVNW